MNREKLLPFWKKYPDGTEILLIHGVQVASIQIAEKAESADEQDQFEVYVYDSDFQELFKQLDGEWHKNIEQLKLWVGVLFLKWIEQCLNEFSDV